MQYGFYGVQVQRAKSRNVHVSKQVICRKERTKVIVSLHYPEIKGKFSVEKTDNEQ